MRARPRPRLVPFTQGAFYVLSGLWPIVHLRSFERVTGKKREPWLVKSMGGLIASVGVALMVGASERRPSRTLPWLSLGSALALGAADVIFSARGRISKVYLADAAAEGAWAASWLFLPPPRLA